MAQALPEPMNASPHHSKVKVTTTLSDPLFVAGGHVTGKIEMECRADRGLGIGIIMVELFALQELSSRDHSATSTFLHCRRLFQGPGLPPSNAVQAHPTPGDPPLPREYYQARRGRSTFLFSIPLPASSPSSINFGNGLAKVRYELRASVGVLYKNARNLVVDKKSVDVVECYPIEDIVLGKIPEGIVVGEGGKLWMQGKVFGPLLVGGQSARLELQVKNHSSKKNTSLTLSLKRLLYLPNSAGTNRAAPVLISDVLATVPYRGPEYTIPPGVEGVANLVFDVPHHARAVRGGTFDGDEESSEKDGPRHTESLFEIRCKVEVKLSMGMGSKDIVLEIPVELVHPKAVPSTAIAPIHNPYAPVPSQAPYNAPYMPPPQADPSYAEYHQPYYHQPPPALPYVDPTHNQVWLPPPLPPMAQPGYPGYAAPASPVQFDQFDPHHHHHQQQHYHVPPPQPQPPLVHHQPTGAPHEYLPASHDLHSLHNFPPAPHPVHVSPHHQPNGNLIVPQHTSVQNFIPRPLSAGAIPIASQISPPAIPGLPPPVGASALLRLPLVPPPSSHHAHPHNLAAVEEDQGDIYASNQHTGYAYTGPSQGDGQPYLQGMDVISGEEGKGDRAERVAQHLRLSSRHRSVSPPSHRYPHPTGPPSGAVPLAGIGIGSYADEGPLTPPAAPLLLPVVPSGSNAHRESQRVDTTGLGVATSPVFSPPPTHYAPLSPSTPLPPPSNGARHQQKHVHSPRPQLTPKHSFTSDPVLNAMSMQRSKSERVEELEKMADVVVRHAEGEDLSGDLPRGKKVDEALAAVCVNEQHAEGVVVKEKSARGSKGKKKSVKGVGDASAEEGGAAGSGSDANVNKTLPGPPVPSGKPRDFLGYSPPAAAAAAAPSSASRPRADLYFNEGRVDVSKEADARLVGVVVETSPLPKDQTPPTPALTALRQRPQQGQTSSLLAELRTESGLDALERRLLEQVGTRKVAKEAKPDVRSVLSAGQGDAETKGKAKAKEQEASGGGDNGGSSLLSSNAATGLASSGKDEGSAPVSAPGSGSLPPIDTTVANRGHHLGVSTSTSPTSSSKPASLSPGPSKRATGTAPIPIPSKSPEPLNESAISSLTLAGRMAALDGDDSDGEFDGRTHKAGKMGGKSGGSSPLKAHGHVGSGEAMFDPELVASGLHMHMRQRAEYGTPKTNDGLAGPSRDKEREREDGGGGGGGKEGKVSGKRKDRSRADKKTDAKGRVAAWLGEIDIGVPPQEEIIPPSPSVVRAPEVAAIFEPLGDDVEDHFAPPPPVSRSKTPTGPSGQSDSANGKAKEARVDDIEPGATIPNPRSSGFVPIATLNRETLTATAYPILARDATVVREAQRIQDLWSTEADPNVSPQKPEDKPGPASKYPLPFAPPPKTQTIRTDRRVSPPSTKPTPSEGLKRPTTAMPMSYSAAAKNVWKPSIPPPPSKPVSTSSGGTSPSSATPTSVATPTARAPGPSGITAALASNYSKAHPPPVPSKPSSIGAPPLAKTPSSSGRLPVFPPPPKPADDGPKYDIRSARGGRGGKVTAVASLWASGAIQNADKEREKSALEFKGGMGIQKRLSVVEENGQLDRTPAPAVHQHQQPPPALTSPPPPALPEKKLFSAALMSPAPKLPPNQTPVSSGQPRHQQQQQSSAHIGVAKWSDPQKRPDSRDLFTKHSPKTNAGSGSGTTSPGKPTHVAGKPPSTTHAPPPKVPSATNLAAYSTPYNPAAPNKATRSSEVLSRPRPGSVSPFPIHSKSPSPTKDRSSPASSEPKLLSAVTKTSGALKPVIKGASDPPAVSSSHATPMLSSTASLARPSQPHGIRSGAPKATTAAASQKPDPSSRSAPATPSTSTVADAASRAAAVLKIPAILAAPLLSATSSTSESTRPTSPSKPTDISFGQGRLRDLIKRYQGGQKT